MENDLKTDKIKNRVEVIPCTPPTRTFNFGLKELITATLCSILCFSHPILPTNLLSKFPKELNVYKNDMIGFEIFNFVNGT